MALKSTKGDVKSGVTKPRPKIKSEGKQRPKIQAQSEIKSGEKSNVKAKESSNGDNEDDVKKDAGVKRKAKQMTKDSANFTLVPKDGNCTIPITAKYEGASMTSKKLKSGDYEHVLKLTAGDAFEVVKTATFAEDHPDAGLQAIYLRPARPFPFLKLPEEVRCRIYSYYFHPPPVSSPGRATSIHMDGKRPGTKEPYAKTYATSSSTHHRVALCAVSRAIHAASTPYLYTHALRFDTPMILLEWLTACHAETRARIRVIEIKALAKPAARMAWGLLAEMHGLETLAIARGVAIADADVAKTVKAFWADAGKFLKEMVEAKGSAEKAVEVLEFGRMAFTVPERNKVELEELKPWSAEMREMFVAGLVEKLK